MSTKDQWNIKGLELSLKFDWVTARNTSHSKTNFIIQMGKNEFVGLGEVAPNIRYGENAELIKKQFEYFLEILSQNEMRSKDLVSFEALANILDEVEVCSSLRFGIEQAFLHYLSELSETSPQKLLGHKEVSSVYTSFSIPLIPIGQIKDFIDKHKLSRFPALKIKINNEESLKRVQEVRKNYKGKLRLDANESFTDFDQLVNFTKEVDPLQIEFLEQPFPADFHQQYFELQGLSPVLIFADESLTNQDISDYFPARFDGVVVKLMKAGSFFKASKQLREAKAKGMYTMLGCMVETSIGISGAMYLADQVDFFDLDGHLLLSKDPYGKVTEEKGRLFFSHLH